MNEQEPIKDPVIRVRPRFGISRSPTPQEERAFYDMLEGWQRKADALVADAEGSIAMPEHL